MTWKRSSEFEFWGEFGTSRDIFWCKFAQVSSIGRLLFNRPVDLSRSISTVDADSPTWKYCRYWRLMQIHLLENTIDLDGQCRFACVKIRLISHQPSISEKNWSKSTVDFGRFRPIFVWIQWIHTNQNRSTAFFREVEKKNHWPMVPEVVRNGPGHTSTKKSWSHVLWEMVLTLVQISTPIHWCIDPVDWSRSISTVNANSPTGEYNQYRRLMPIHLRRITVDRRLSIKNRHNLWLISSTTPVQIWSCDRRRVKFGAQFGSTQSN